MATIDLKLKTYEQLQFEVINLITKNYLQQQELDKYKNIVDDVYEFVEWHYKDNQEYYKNKGIGLNYPECDYILNKLKELRGFENE